MASKRTLNPYFSIFYLYWSIQFWSLVFIICFAPSSSNNFTCSFLLTMFSKGIPNLWQYLFNILPNADAAPVLMSPFPFYPWKFHFPYVDTIPITVIGLTIPEAAHYTGTSESTSQTLSTSVTVYSAHDPSIVTKETLLPISFLFY